MEDGHQRYVDQGDSKTSAHKCPSATPRNTVISQGLVTDCVSVTKLSCLLTELTRHYYCAHHDHAQHHRKEVPP